MASTNSKFELLPFPIRKLIVVNYLNVALCTDLFYPEINLFKDILHYESKYWCGFRSKSRSSSDDLFLYYFKVCIFCLVSMFNMRNYVFFSIKKLLDKKSLKLFILQTGNWGTHHTFIVIEFDILFHKRTKSSSQTTMHSSTKSSGNQSSLDHTCKTFNEHHITGIWQKNKRQRETCTKIKT